MPCCLSTLPNGAASTGPELSDLLHSQPLGARVVVDVLFGGLRQRVRSAEPSVILGTPAMLAIAGLFAWSMAADSRDGLSALVRPSGITFPTYTVGPMNSVRIGSYDLDV